MALASALWSATCMVSPARAMVKAIIAGEPSPGEVLRHASRRLKAGGMKSSKPCKAISQPVIALCWMS